MDLEIINKRTIKVGETIYNTEEIFPTLLEKLSKLKFCVSSCDLFDWKQFLGEKQGGINDIDIQCITFLGETDSKISIQVQWDEFDDEPSETAICIFYKD